MLKDALVGNGEGSSSIRDVADPDSADSSEVDDPVLAHSRDNALLDDDFIDAESQSPLVSQTSFMLLRANRGC